MGFHLEEEFIANGFIDNRVKGCTLIRINFTNPTSSLITLQGNPCHDLAGSQWAFRNPHAVMDDLPGEQRFFVPALCEGAVGRISHTQKREVPILPPDEHYDRLFDPDMDDPPTKIAPVLELEWFSQKYKQVEIDCSQIYHDGGFEDIPGTIALLTTLLPFIERASESAKHLAETTAETLLQLRAGIVALRKELTESTR